MDNLYKLLENPFTKDCQVLCFLQNLRDVVNLTSRNGTPLISHCCKRNWLESLKFLVEKGVSVNVVSQKGLIPLHYCDDNSLECAQYLIEKGADVNYKSIHCYTPLAFTCTRTVGCTRMLNLKLAKLLLDSGADVNLKDSRGKTAVYYSCKNRDLEMTELLLSYGAQLDERLLEHYHFNRTIAENLIRLGVKPSNLHISQAYFPEKVNILRKRKMIE